MLQDGAEIAARSAHSALLLDLLYFRERIKSTAERPWSFRNKLRIRLPVPCSSRALEVFRNFLYGDGREVYRLADENGSKDLQV